MSRPPSVTPNEHLHVRLTPDMKTRLDLLLYSEVEGRIPKGAHMEFITARLKEFFAWRTLDLEPLGFPKGHSVAALPETLTLLQTYLSAPIQIGGF